MNMSTLSTGLHRACIIALAAMVASPTAQAADETLTLACQGTVSVGKTAEGKPEPTSLGIIINFTKGTVHGLADFPANITRVDETIISFSGSRPYASVDGSIDRVTGEAEATSILMNMKTRDILLVTSYALKCRPAQRMF